MKLKINGALATKVGCFLLLIAVAPFAFEFLLIADFVGVEFAATLMLLYFKDAFEAYVIRWWRFKAELREGIYQLSQSFLFQPKTYGVSATATCLLVMLIGSTFVAFSIWLPVIAMNGGHLL